MERVAEIKNESGGNLLHQAAELLVRNEDTELFFVRLLDLNFPLYSENSKGETAASILTRVKNDSKFLTAFYA